MRRIKDKTATSKTGGITWLQISGRSVMIVIVLAALAVIGLLGWRSWSLWNELYKPIEHKTPYNESYQAADYPGKTFLGDLLSEVPDGITADKWTVSEDGKNDTAVKTLPSTCTQIAPSTAQLAYKTAKTDGATIVVMAYGAGQAHLQFDKYAAQLSECYQDAKTSNTMIDSRGGFILTRGDAIVSVISDDQGKLDSLKTWYVKKLDEKLAASACASLDETSNDASRSFYYDENSYTGTTKSEKVSVADTVLTASAPQILTDNSMSMSKAFVDPKSQNVKVPLDPLPAGMESSLPVSPVMPTISSQPALPAVEKTVTYQIADKTGPGCGWAWSGQKTPKFDEDTLAANRKTIVANAKTELKNNILDYNKSIIDWSKQTALAMSFESSWDDYVNKTNTIYASWNDLNSKRDSIKDAWYSYVDAAEKYATWDDTVKQAQSDWEDSVKQCVSQAITDDTDENQRSNGKTGGSNDDDSDSTSSSTGDEDDHNSIIQTKTKAEIQRECETKTVKPDVLSQDRPTKPSAPVIPDGVTIPSSWPKDPLA